MSDLISRSNLLQMIEKDIKVTIDFLNGSDKYSTHNNFDVLYGVLKTLQEYREIIKRYPTVEAKPVVHGEWIEHFYTKEYLGSLMSEYECSICHEWVDDDSNFCPNCGADMRGGKND